MIKEEESAPAVDAAEAQSSTGDRSEQNSNSPNESKSKASGAKPETFAGDLSALPAALKPLEEERRWVVWRWEWKVDKKTGKGKWDKPPYQTRDPERNAKNNDRSTWGTYQEAVARVKEGKADGIGLNLLDGDLGAVDLDKCRNLETGLIDPWALAILDRSPPDAYVEITVSGTGLRVIGVTSGASLDRKFPVDDGPGQYEVYRSNPRYITVSGCALDGRGGEELPNIDTLLDELDAEGLEKRGGKKRGRGRPKGSKNKKELPRHLMIMLYADDPGPNKPLGEYQKRSAALFALLKLALAAGVGEDKLVEVVLDESRFKDKAIYEQCVKSGGEDYLRRQIDRASEEDLESKDGRKIVKLDSGKLPKIVRDIERHIKASSKCQVYRRSIYLVEPLYHKVTDSKTGKVYLETSLQRLNVSQLGHLVQKHVIEFQHWVKSEEEFKATDWTSAKDALETLLSLQHQDLPRIRGIIMSPTMRADGSIITQEGYDEATQLWYRKSPDLLEMSIPEKPTEEEARAALQVFEELLVECAFATPIDKSVALAAILTVALRAAFPNAPHFKFDAPSPRTGKSYLCEVIMMIPAGLPMMPTAGSSNKEEMEKRIETALVNGRSNLYLNNLSDGLNLSSAALEGIATEGMATIRKLGTMDELMADCRGVTTVIINGNNIILVGALVERTLNCRLDAKEENPGERTYKQRPKEMIRADRGKYLAAAFTIARAYRAAGCPKVEMIQFAGFEDWSKIVREPLIWLGVADPVATIEGARALDPVKQELRTFQNVLWTYVGDDKEFDAAYLEGMANTYRPPTDDSPGSRPTLAWPELHQALLDVRGRISAKSIGNKLTRFLDTIVDGFRIERTTKDPKKANKYRLAWHGKGEKPKRPTTTTTTTTPAKKPF